MILRRLNYSFVMSKMEYPSSVWNPGFLGYSSRIECIQRPFAKYLTWKSTGVDHQREADAVLLWAAS